jgi:hypothetical protein
VNGSGRRGAQSEWLAVIADRYVAFAEDYYEIQVDRSTVEHIVAQVPLTDAMVRALNPEATLATLRADIPRPDTRSQPDDRHAA